MHICVCIFIFAFIPLFLHMCLSPQSTVTLARIFPYYVCTVLFLLPYLASTVYYPLEISYHIDQIDMGGIITEPDPPADVLDLSDVSLFQSCVFVIALPCVMCIQCSDLLRGLKRAYAKHYRDQPLFASKAKVEQPQEKKKRRVLRRLWKTATRWFRGSKKKEVAPDAPPPPLPTGTGALQLADIQQDREEMERLEREKAVRAREEEKRGEEAALAMREAERKRGEQELLDVARQMAERRRKEEEERLRKEEESRGWDRALSVSKFKALWSSLPTAGSFQCNLKSLPAITHLTEHLKRQGFNIVFAAKPSPADVEVGVCNVRTADSEVWFMARFLATATSFSAVMKAQEASQVTAYVKKFALAKVLKIDKGA
mmetsp:Transcript_22575/g.50193  ORF Transcript_22575/g.50193 Transcript_22575/m.50193 type:complete len:372 (+) Transcript_22575:762-1877(+)